MCSTANAYRLGRPAIIAAYMVGISIKSLNRLSPSLETNKTSSFMELLLDVIGRKAVTRGCRHIVRIEEDVPVHGRVLMHKEKQG